MVRAQRVDHHQDHVRPFAQGRGDARLVRRAVCAAQAGRRQRPGQADREKKRERRQRLADAARARSEEAATEAEDEQREQRRPRRGSPSSTGAGGICSR